MVWIKPVVSTQHRTGGMVMTNNTNTAHNYNSATTDDCLVEYRPDPRPCRTSEPIERRVTPRYVRYS